MGRHSAPDDDGDVGAREDGAGDGAQAGAATTVDTLPSRGRHSRGGADAAVGADGAGGADRIETDETTEITPIADPVLDEPVPQAVTDRFPPVRADLAPDPADSVYSAGGGSTATATAEPAAETPTDTSPDAAAAATDEAATGEVSASPAPAPAPSPETPRAGGRSDAALVRAHHGVQAGCAAAVLVPIGVYLLVMAVLDHFEVRQLLIFVWAPLIVAGVLVGLVLDVGHRRHASRTHDAPPPDPAE